MSNNARLFDQFWLYPSPAIKKEGSGSDGAVEAGRPESFKGGIDLFSGFPGWSPVQEGAATVGASGLLVTMPRPAGYHLQVEALAPGMPFPQATVKGSGQTILLIEF